MQHRDLVKSQLFRAARAPVDIRLEVTCFMASVLERQEANDVYGPSYDDDLRLWKIDMVTMVRVPTTYRQPSTFDVDFTE